MKLRLRLLRALAFAALLSACAPLGTISFQVPETDVLSFVFRDARPPALRQSRLLASGGRIVEVFGDDRLSPAIPRLLPAVLQRDLGERLRGAEVVLNSFELVMVSAVPRFSPENYRNVVGRSPGNDPAPGVSGSGFGVASGPARYSAQVIGSVNGRVFQARSDLDAAFESDGDAARVVLDVIAAAIRQIGGTR